MQTAIKTIAALEILDSRGNPTVGVRVELEDGTRVLARVPSGASTGAHEAVELRDGGGRYRGKGVRQACEHVNTLIAPALAGHSALNQHAIDDLLRELDGHPQKARLGANSILGVSLGVMLAAAKSVGLPLYRYLGGTAASLLPVPMLNVLNGGAHADNTIDIQEFMLVPAGAATFAEAMAMAVETYHTLKDLLKQKGLRTAVGDEGGFAPDLADDREALDLLVASIAAAGYEPGRDIALALDVAATELYHDGRYRMAGTARGSEEQIAWYEHLLRDYPIVSIEDGLAEDDWAGWQQLTAQLGDRVQLVGDDLLVTNPDRIRRAIGERAANAVLVKLNQIGTVTETLQAIRLAQAKGWRAIVSHRSGETEDTVIADLAVAVNGTQIKTGAPARSERVAKYNRLLLLEATDPELGYAGWEAFGK